MMAFKNDFVVSVKVAGKPQRDAKGKDGERNVFLPHDTEYSLLLKNLTDRRAAASVHIDGSDALGGERIVVDARSSIELRRFMLDGDMNKGDAFKFVSVDSKDDGIVDPSSPDNGLIEVAFYREKERTCYVPYYYHREPCMPFEPQVWCSSGDMLRGMTIGSSAGATKGVPDASVMSCHVSSEATQDMADAGATVEGRTVNQTFFSTSFDTETFPASTIKLRLKVRRGVRVKVTRSSVDVMQYCPMCARKVDPNWNNCPYCATELD